MKAVITNSHVNIAGVGYFVYDAPNVTFGGWGRKMSPVLHKNGLNQMGTIPAPKLAEVDLVVTTLDVEFSGAVGAEFFAGVKVPGLAKGSVKLGVGAFRDGEVRLTMVSPKGDNELIRQINASPAVLRQLIETDGSVRLVETVLIVVEAKLHTRFMASLSAKGAVVVDGVMVRAEGAAGLKNETTVEVGRGTCLGYSLAEPEWDAAWDKNKTRVVGLRPDRHGL